ncbi:uncharacterized protein LOC110440521 [Mizuhopecten yessoensis]|uniref:BTB and MATH domain-containing protein 38 n=1 Tax=Mizuhopecten yessoensis TaxID=6573 RepID=A0A210PKY0_MIZYE|nr:uncharacterized protein LOC110440521 [Mizuhopecten yessoensis]OWF37150.1 BTB and MATH domain-containing protein 38 [Mizuhopecten yessoensis]
MQGLSRPRARCLRPASPSMSTTGSTSALNIGTRTSNSQIPLKQARASKDQQEKDNVIPFVHEDAFTDLVLIVEGKRLHTSTALLSMCSPVFARMLATSADGDQSSGGKDGTRRELQLQGKCYEYVHELLYVIHPAYQRKISDDLAFVVLPLAEEYQIWNLKQKCEETLLGSLNVDKTVREDVLLRCLNMAEEFKLFALWTKCLQICSKTTLSLQALQRSPEYENLSKFLKSMLEAFKGSGSGAGVDNPPLVSPSLQKSSAAPVHQGYGNARRENNGGSLTSFVDDRGKKSMTNIQTQTKY